MEAPEAFSRSSHWTLLFCILIIINCKSLGKPPFGWFQKSNHTRSAYVLRRQNIRQRRSMRRLILEISTAKWWGSGKVRLHFFGISTRREHSVNWTGSPDGVQYPRQLRSPIVEGSMPTFASYHFMLDVLLRSALLHCIVDVCFSGCGHSILRIVNKLFLTKERILSLNRCFRANSPGTNHSRDNLT